MYNEANVAADPTGHPIVDLEPDSKAPGSYAHPTGAGLSTTQVPFVEYLLHARRSRQYEEQMFALKPRGKSSGVFSRFGSSRMGGAGVSSWREFVMPDVTPVGHGEPTSEESSEKGEKNGPVSVAVAETLTAEERERINARRALRSAGWAAVFYLITTDILGPFNAPFALSQVGYVPGVILYFVMGLIAAYTGLLLWYLFMRLDSDIYPVKTYADITRRIFGTGAAHAVNILQSIQLIINVGTICLSNGQSLSQISKGHLCFAVCIVIWAFVGMGVGQVRTLKNYGWLANSAVWLNLSLIFISMGFIAHSPPNIAAAQAAYGPQIGSGPVQTHTFVSLPLSSKVNGIMNMVFAYGGAMIFPEMLAEMRRPWDFWKGMVCAQLLIFVAYLMFGVFVYSFQGQYTLPLAYQGVSRFAWQTVGNVIALITGIIAAGLYGNIGIKVAYYSIVEGMLKGPRLESRMGKRIWIGMVLLYWSLAFIVGAAIPQVQTISGLVAAVCIMQFTYTFPPLLVFGYLVRMDGVLPDGTFSVKAGLRRGHMLFKWANFVLFLASLSMACLGMFGSGVSISNTFKTAQATSFGCSPPV